MHSNVVLSMALVVALALVGADAHARWKCPEARDKNDAEGNHIVFNNTGNKYGPCGPFSGKWGMGAVTTIKPGWNTFEWEESVSHAGAPFQISILDENEVSRVVLLDHIPHWDAAAPNPADETTYVPYRITAFVPDIDCAKCSIRVLYLMTDKTVKCGTPTCTYYPEDNACSGQLDPAQPTCTGAPNDTPCKVANTCFSNYHTCTDVKITGRRPIHDVKFPQPYNWPFRHQPVGSNYSSEAGTWKDGWLQGVPADFTTKATDFCVSNN